MSSDSGILLIRNDGTIQLKGDSKILGEYHLKHRLMARLKPDGSMGVFMIPEQGPNSGKMFAVLPNGPSGKEGVGWEHVVSRESTYLRPVFRPMKDKKTTSSPKNPSAKSTKPPLSSSEPVVIDLCDDTDPVVSQQNESAKPTQSAAPVPVMMFTKDNAARLNALSMIVTSSSKTTSDSDTLNNQTISSTSKCASPALNNGAIAQSIKDPAIAVTCNNVTSTVHNVSKNTQIIGSSVQKVKQNENVARTVVQSNIPSVTSTRTMSNTSISPTLNSANVFPSKTLFTVSQNYTPTIASYSQQNLCVSSRPSTVQVPIQSLVGGGQLPFTTKGTNPVARTVNADFNTAQNPRRQAVPTGHHQGISTSFSTLNRGGLVSSARPSLVTPQLPTVNFPSVPLSSVTKSQTSNETTVTKTIISVDDPKPVTKSHTEVNETPIQINSVFSLAPIDPIKPWLTNGKNMPLSEVDFWSQAINLMISDEILADKRLRKGCSVVLQRTTSHRPRKLRGCRVKDSQCTVACRKLFVKKLLKDLSRKKHLKLKRRSIYASLSLQIRKKVKETQSKISEQPKKQAPQSIPALNNFPQRRLTNPVQQPTPRIPNFVPPVSQIVRKPNLPNQNRYLLLRMNGQNVLVPNPSTNVSLNSLVSVTLGGVANVGTPTMQVNSLNNPRSLLGTRLALSCGNSLTRLGPNLPNTSIPSVSSLPQLSPINNVLPRAPVSSVIGAYSLSTSIQSGSNMSNSSLPMFNPQSATVGIPVPPVVSSGQVRLGMVNHSTPYPVAVRAANLVTQSTPYPVAVRTVLNPSAPSRPLLQSQLTAFTARTVTSTGLNTVVRTLPPTSSSTSFLSSQATLPTTTSTATTATSDVQTPVDEPISSVAKSKVNKGTKYYFIPGGVKIKTEPKSSGYGDEGKKHKKHKKHKRPRSPDSECSIEKSNKKQRVEIEENLADETLLSDIAKVSSETDIENLSKSEMSAERIKQLREKLSENQRKLEEYLRQVDH